VLMGLLDTVMSGQAGAFEQAVVGLGVALWIPVFIGLMSVVQAVSPVIAHHYGAGDHAAVVRDAREGVWLAIGVSVVPLLLVPWAHDLLTLAGIAPALAERATVFLWGIGLGLPAALTYRSLAFYSASINQTRPIMVLSFLGLLVSVIKAKHRWAMFAGLWAWGLFAAYTIIPYKTPWLAISFIMPMCLAAGYAVGEMLESRNNRLRTATYVLIAGGLAMLTYQTYQLNFVRYDDDQMGYVYAHTKRGYKDMIAKIEYYAEKSGKGKDAQIEIVSSDYWPMTWDLNKYTRAYFQGHLVDATTAEMLVTKKGEQDAQVIPKYSEHYKLAGYYPLRPGVDLCILVRKDLADPDAQDLSKLPTLPSLP